MFLLNLDQYLLFIKLLLKLKQFRYVYMLANISIVYKYSNMYQHILSTFNHSSQI